MKTFQCPTCTNAYHLPVAGNVTVMCQTCEVACVEASDAEWRTVQADGIAAREAAAVRAAMEVPVEKPA